ncbi:hypothetical protein Q8A67_024491 [Cirrhinus molitorella]|uniref:Uncharacterized protein n=1 Tax=Cirrhinus molitorella TaxID=172907 RepID=A0AA88P4R4_9TELE|nr:hypothetical protein Q8A67_024491 [Cirrhinus molitorella]
MTEAAFEVRMMTPIGAVSYTTPPGPVLLKAAQIVPAEHPGALNRQISEVGLGEKQYPVYVLPALLTSTCVGCQFPLWLSRNRHFIDSLFIARLPGLGTRLPLPRVPLSPVRRNLNDL